MKQIHSLKDFPQTDYNYVRDNYFEYWNEAEEKFSLPYFPNVTMGWDSTPRTLRSDKYIETGYPYIATLSGNTPQNFQKALEITKNRVSKQKHGMNILLKHLEDNPDKITQESLSNDKYYKNLGILRLDIAEINGKWGR